MADINALYNDLRDRIMEIEYVEEIGMGKPDLLRVYNPTRKNNSRDTINVRRDPEGRDPVIGAEYMTLTFIASCKDEKVAERLMTEIVDKLHGYQATTDTITIYRCHNTEGPLEPGYDDKTNSWTSEARFLIWAS